jgi:hypothetical protein
MEGKYGRELSEQQPEEEEKPGVSQSQANEGGAQGDQPAASPEVGAQEA